MNRGLIYILIGSILVTVIIIIYLYVAFGTKDITIISPDGEEEWEIGQTYEITWKTRKVDKIGIVLFDGTEPEWIAEDIDANLSKYQWKVYPGHSYGYGFWIAVFEYPWKQGNEIDYSNGAFAITYPEFSSCDSLSIESEWPYIAIDSPDLRRVFITSESFKGNLDGFEGADQKCQQQAEKLGFEGNWMAFIGGDKDEDSALERLAQTEKGTQGVFIQAEPLAVLIRGATCHRLLGRNFDDFLAKFSNLAVVNKDKLDQQFFKDMQNLWLGRINKESRKNCISVSSATFANEKYSFTSTCQNWTQDKKRVEDDSSFPSCYTPSGDSTEASGLAGLSSDLINEDRVFSPFEAKYCNTLQKLLCIEK